MWDRQTVLAYVACVVLIVAHAWGRFNTPTSNRASTRQALYWKSFVGYAASAVAMFAVLSVLLEVGEWRKLLLGKSDDLSLSAPLIATLALTTLLPSVPLLQRVDAWVLSAFHNWGEIPGEVRRRAAQLSHRRFAVTEDDVTRLRETYGEDRYGERLAEQLSAVDAEEGLARSRFRFTRVVKLYDCIVRLEEAEAYGRFFHDWSTEYAALKERMEQFMPQAAASLALAGRLHATETPAAYEDLMQERRQQFALTCRERFDELALFLARAVLRSERSERDIVKRLRSIGFAADPIELPDFPIDDLTLVAVGLFAYLIGLSAFFANISDLPQEPGWFAVAFKIALIRILTVGMTIWLLQRYAFFRRELGGRPAYSSYAVCGLLAAAVSFIVSLPFHLGDLDLVRVFERELPPMLLSGLLCSVLAFCCDDWTSDTPPPWTLRLREAGLCGGVVAIGVAIIFVVNLLPFQVTGTIAVAWFVLPTVMAAAIGGFVPHIYRAARHAAAMRRQHALSGAAPSVPVAGFAHRLRQQRPGVLPGLRSETGQAALPPGPSVKA